jgi:hypothetical protein
MAQHCGQSRGIGTRAGLLTSLVTPDGLGSWSGPHFRPLLPTFGDCSDCGSEQGDERIPPTKLLITAMFLLVGMASAQHCRKIDIDRSGGFCTVPDTN